MPRPTLADANQQRPAVIFEKAHYKLYERLSAELAAQPQQAPNLKIIYHRPLRQRLSQGQVSDPQRGHRT